LERPPGEPPRAVIAAEVKKKGYIMQITKKEMTQNKVILNRAQISFWRGKEGIRVGA
jgi:hypothetical protein